MFQCLFRIHWQKTFVFLEMSIFQIDYVNILTVDDMKLNTFVLNLLNKYVTVLWHYLL